MDAHLACSPPETLLALTDDARAATRLSAIRALCPCHLRRDLPAVWNRLLELAKDPDAKVRAHILHTLADGSPRHRGDEVAWAIGTMVQDPDPKLRRRARRVMAAFRRTGSAHLL